MIATKRVTAVVDRVHQFIFGHAPGNITNQFLAHLSWSFTGGLVASGILFILNVIAGRVLGVSAYGEFTVISTVAQLIMYVLLFGMDIAALRVLPASDLKERRVIIATSLVCVCVAAVGLLIVLTVLQEPLAGFLHITQALWRLGVVYGIILAGRQLFDSDIRGLALFKLQSFIRALEALSAVIIFLILRFGLGMSSSSTYVLALIGSGLILLCLYGQQLRQYVGHFSQVIFRQLFRYGRLSFLGTILSVLFVSLDKVFIAHYLGWQDIGTYSAYYLASYVIGAQLVVFFDNVFFPTVSYHRQSMALVVKKVDRLTLWGAPLAYVGLVLVVIVVISLFGHQYHFSWLYVFLFSLLAVLKMILAINGSMNAAYSEISLGRLILCENILNVIFLGGYAWLIWSHWLSILSVVCLLITYHVFSIAVSKYIQHSVGGFYTAS